MTRHIIDNSARHGEAGSRLRHYLQFERRARPGKDISVAKHTERTRRSKGRLLAFVRIERGRGTLV